ncbi:hypothetical protein HMI54_011654 [Coelomomyces lativittatus]|nr:hypothetical protein HMI56_006673 [Coelomomyces lativittatus]KAJ1515814.1 hypothetical protein HMI54_011654 [Coelomomyces lativittatus]KAJ1517128.1 hypothetical protein HMI55_000563 [Coelomomyces lativittatus]
MVNQHDRRLLGDPKAGLDTWVLLLLPCLFPYFVLLLLYVPPYQQPPISLTSLSHISHLCDYNSSSLPSSLLSSTVLCQHSYKPKVEVQVDKAVSNYNECSLLSLISDGSVSSYDESETP